MGNQSTCAQTVSYSACNCDNFSAPNEAPSPSAGVLSWISSNWAHLGARNCDDNSADKYWAHTFWIPAPPAGCQIQSATLTIQVHNGDGNDALVLGFLTGYQAQWSLWKHLTDLGVPVGQSGTIVLDLDNLPGGGSLINDIQHYGILDVAVEDDSGVDCATLTITYGP